MTDDKGSVHDALRGAGSDSEHMERRLKPLSGFSGTSGEMRELAATISRDIYLHSPNVRWEDIIGLEDAKRLVKDAVVYPIKYPQVFTGILCPWKGLLLYGPPVQAYHDWLTLQLDSRVYESHFTKMFSWGEDCRHAFRLKDVPSGDGVVLLESLLNIVDLSAGRSVLAYVKSNGNAFIIRTIENNDGTRATGKQKLVEKCRVKFQAVSCGDNTVTLLSDCGIVFCVDTSQTPFNPRTPGALCNIPVSQVACGSQHSVALTKDGQVYTWGQGSRGQLGLGKEKQDTSSPRHLRTLSAIPLVQISAGGEQSFALSVSGGVFGWGRNDCGQLGLGDKTDRHTPTSVHCLNMKKTVAISCGNDHTVILTKTGAVFTFGSGQYGQLGHNSFRDELRPRLVAELWGAKVTNIACGRHHTLVMTASKTVYSFGCGEQGQLAHGEESHPSVPLPVQLPQDATKGLIIRNIYAGRNYSFATCNSLQRVGEETNTDKITQHCIDDGMIDLWITTCKSKAGKKRKKEIHRMFSSASCLNQSFLDRSKDKHFQTSPNYSGLDLSLAQLAFGKLGRMDFLLREVEAAVLQLLPSLEEKPVGVEGLRIFLLLNELLHVIQSTEFALKVAAAIQRLSAESLQVIGHWWSSLSPTTMVKNVEAWKQVLSVSLIPIIGLRSPEYRNLLLILQHMYNGENYQPFILCDFPFVMDLTTKIQAFTLDTKRSKGFRKLFIRLLNGLPPLCECFELRLKRAALWEDTFTQLAAAPHSTFKKTLLVYLDEDPKVTNVYKTDLFQHVFNDIVSTQPRMFLFNDSKTLVWFPSKVAEEDKTIFFFFGVLCGLALYNECIIHLPFPLALFKKLLDVEPTLEDMKGFSSIGRSLQDILDYEDDVLENLYMGFLIHWDGTEVDLDPQNPGKLVTSQNKKEFVDAYVNHVFSTSVEGVFQEFKRGFFQVCERRFLKLFRPEELQEMLVGKDVFNWAKLKQNTVYVGVNPAKHPTILMFWEVFEELTEDQRKDFIWFLTGFRRVPALGMDQIRMKIQVKEVQSNSHDQHYPESLTCHSILVLPLYSTKEIMRDRLTEALIPESVFLM